VDNVTADNAAMFTGSENTSMQSQTLLSNGRWDDAIKSCPFSHDALF